MNARQPERILFPMKPRWVKGNQNISIKYNKSCFFFNNYLLPLKNNTSREFGRIFYYLNLLKF
jgi:hypothetical protein